MITKLQVKYIQSLGQKKVRDQEHVFVAEGPKIINELLRGGLVPVSLYATDNWLTHYQSLLPTMKSVAVAVTPGELARLSFQQTPHDVIAVFNKPATTAPSFANGLALALDGIQDPGNMGTIIRTADWFGVRSIICSADCADAFAPKVIQSTMGSILRVQLLYTDLPAFMHAHASLQYFATVPGGQNLAAFSGGIKSGVLVIGNESKGISAAVLAQCQQRISIPGAGTAESLNAAVATGIVLSHVVG